LFKGMALHPTVKKALILSGKIGVPLAATYGTIKLGVWGSAGDSLPLTDQVRAVLPDASSVVDQLPNLGSYGDAVKSAWNSGISATTGSIVAIPGAIGRGLSSVKNSIFGKKDE